MDLYQGTYWGDEGGNKLRISEMTGRHAYNCTRWLIRHAKVIELHDSFQFMRMLSGPFAPSGEMASMDLANEIDAMQREREDPVKWIKSTDLWQALDARAKEEPASMGELFSREDR